MRRALVAAGVAIFAATAGMATPALAQQPGPPPTVDILPHDSSRETDPNGGEWFVTSAAPGQTKSLQAKLTNPATVPQTVRLYLADLVYGEDGTPRIPDPPYRELGTWGSFDRSTVTIPPGATVVERFSITVPEGAEPGDWVGMAVVEHGAIDGPQGGLDIVRRVATKVYVTIPGDAPRDFSIDRVDIEKDSWLFPREVTLRVWLKNEGRIRLQPTVLVNGEPAKGSALLMTKSQEPYLITLPVKFWGGPLGFRVDASTHTAGEQAGPARQMRVSTFVVPWHLLFLALLAAAGVYLLRWIARKRGTKYDALKSDIRRIERLLSAQAAGGVPAGTADDPEVAIMAALKQARRAGDPVTEARLEEKLSQARAQKAPIEIGSPEEPSNDAVAVILRHLASAPDDERPPLIKAARVFGVQALRKHPELLESLPEGVRTKLLAPPRARKPAASKQGAKRRP